MSAILAYSPQSERYVNPGVSKAAEHLRKFFADFRDHIRNTGRFGDKLIGLDAAFEEASDPDWDGNGAAAADSDSYDMACEFLSMLPERVSVPEFSVDPDGDISLEWFFSKSRIFTISVGGDGSLTYVGFLGKKRIKGVEHFDQQIPGPITRAMDRILPKI